MRFIPEDNMAYPVFLKLDNGNSGSAFFLKTNDKFFLITARHVLFKGDNLQMKNLTLTYQSVSLADENTYNIQIDLQKVSVLKHKTHDVAAIEMGIIKNSDEDKSYLVHPHVGVNFLKEEPTTNVDAKNSTKLLKDVIVSNDVIIYGYPTSLGIKESRQFDYNKPLLRKGIIANVYPQNGTIILDCPVYPGNSGGPVIEITNVKGKNEHKIIGVVSQFVPFEERLLNLSNNIINKSYSNSGYSVAVAMDKVFELIGFKK